MDPTILSNFNFKGFIEELEKKQQALTERLVLSVIRRIRNQQTIYTSIGNISFKTGPNSTHSCTLFRLDQEGKTKEIMCRFTIIFNEGCDKESPELNYYSKSIYYNISIIIAYISKCEKSGDISSRIYKITINRDGNTSIISEQFPILLLDYKSVELQNIFHVKGGKIDCNILCSTKTLPEKLTMVTCTFNLSLSLVCRLVRPVDTLIIYMVSNMGSWELCKKEYTGHIDGEGNARFILSYKNELGQDRVIPPTTSYKATSHIVTSDEKKGFCIITIDTFKLIKKFPQTVRTVIIRKDDVVVLNDYVVEIYSLSDMEVKLIGVINDMDVKTILKIDINEYILITTKEEFHLLREPLITRCTYST